MQANIRVQDQCELISFIIKTRLSGSTQIDYGPVPGLKLGRSSSWIRKG